jgi:hypothetical protein
MFWKPNLSHIHGLAMALLMADAVDGSQTVQPFVTITRK